LIKYGSAQQRIALKLIRSADSPHEARPTAGGWEVSWLPGQTLTRSQAVSAMQITAKVGRGVEQDDRMWPHIDRVALLGLSGTDAVVRASELAAGEAGT
jgi:hypothetical protein